MVANPTSGKPLHVTVRELVDAVNAGAGGYTDEQVRDVIGAALVAGTNITLTVNDAGDTITIAAAGGSSYTDEQAQDAVAALLAAGTHTGVTFAYNDAANTLSATVTGSAGFAPPMPAPGKYAFTSSPASAGTIAQGVGALRLVPWLVTKSFAIDRIGVEVVTAGEAGSVYRLGIYADSGSGLPAGAALLDTTVPTDAVGIPEATVSLTLPPGLYWIGGAVQQAPVTAPVLRTTNQWFPPVTMQLSTTKPTANQAAVGVVLSGATGALPNWSGDLPSGTATRVFVRAA